MRCNRNHSAAAHVTNTSLGSLVLFKLQLKMSGVFFMRHSIVVLYLLFVFCGGGRPTFIKIIVIVIVIVIV